MCDTGELTRVQNIATCPWRLHFLAPVRWQMVRLRKTVPLSFACRLYHHGIVWQALRKHSAPIATVMDHLLLPLPVPQPYRNAGVGVIFWPTFALAPYSEVGVDSQCIQCKETSQSTVQLQITCLDRAGSIGCPSCI